MMASPSRHDLAGNGQARIDDVIDLHAKRKAEIYG